MATLTIEDLYRESYGEALLNRGILRKAEGNAYLDGSIERVLDASITPLERLSRKAQVARSALAVSASSAPLEKVSSQAGLVPTDKRNRFKPERLGTNIG